MTKTKTETIKTNSDLFLFIKGLILSLIVTFASIIVFALVIKFANLSDSIISPVNLVIKALAVTVGTICYTKNKTSGLKKGLIFAATYTTLAFVIFSLLSSSFSLSLSLLLDYVFTGLVASIVGIIRVNRKK